MKPNLAIVEDDPDLRRLIRETFAREGYTPSAFADGLSFLASLSSFVPDLVILDVMMPRKNGYALCSELKADPATKDIPVVLLTAVADHVTTTTYSHADGMITEADDYIPKPVDTKSLWNSVAGFMG